MIVSYFKNIRKDKIIFLIISVILTVIAFFYISNSEGYFEMSSYLKETNELLTSTFPLECFYYMQTTALTIWVPFIFYIALTNLHTADTISYKDTKFSYVCKTRVGNRKYNKSNIIINSIVSFLFILLIQIVLLILVYIFIAPFDLSLIPRTNYSNYANVFSHDYLLNLVIYIIAASLGFTVFSNLLFAICKFLKNIYLIRGFGVIFSVLLTAIPAIIFVTLYRKLNLEYLLDVGSLLFLPNLLNPGIQLLNGHLLFNSAYLSFVLPCFFYLVITIIVLHIANKREYTYD